MIGFSWANEEGFQNVLSMVLKIVNIMRIVVPIGLIVMTTIDITKKVIDPNEKEGQQKIMRRAIAALIVFLLPTIINVFLKIAGIDTTDLDIGGGGSSKTPAPVVSDDANKHLNSLSIGNCPSSSNSYRKGDKITLNTNIPSSYSGDITWSAKTGDKHVSFNRINGDRSVEITVADVEFDTTSTIIVEADGKQSSCTIKLDKEKINNLSFTNCPRDTASYKVGTKVTLKTNIPASYQGQIKWRSDDDSVVRVLESKDQREATIEIISRPKIGSTFITVTAGGEAKACYINIHVVDELKIENCPSDSQIYHVGDKLTLKSNLPNSYKGAISWGGDTSAGIFKVTPSSDEKEATVEILSVPTYNYAHVSLGADSKGVSCKIHIESNEVPIEDPTETPAPTPYVPVVPPTINCKNPTYNGSSQLIATCINGTISYNAYGTNAGNYDVICNGASAVSKSCSIEKANGVINGFSDITMTVGQSKSLSATGTGDISYSVISGNAIMVDGTGIVALSTGTATLRATVSSSKNYKQTTKDIKVTVKAAPATPTPKPTAKPTPTPTPKSKIKCSSNNDPYLTNVSVSYCNDIYSNYIQLLTGAEQQLRSGKYYRYYGCLKGTTSGKYNVFECMIDK